LVLKFLCAWLGFTLHKMEDGESELHFTPRPEHLNSFGVTHGGASMTLMDVTMAVAARSVDFDLGVVTIEMKTSFMQAANGPLVGKGVLLHRTGTMALPKAASTMPGPTLRTCHGHLQVHEAQPKADGELQALPRIE
jgi:uncharacterized protein (TIGR00369 family)